MLEDDQIVQNNDAALGASIPSSPDSVREAASPLVRESRMDEGRPENLESTDSARHAFEEGDTGLPEISSDAEPGMGRTSRLKSDIIPILDISSDEQVDWGKKGKGKKSGKKGRKVSSADAVIKGMEELSMDQFSCNVCEEVYNSRTKLFEHVRESGHALASEGAGSSSGKKSKKGKRK
jgi:hypothetical protein